MIGRYHLIVMSSRIREKNTKFIKKRETDTEQRYSDGKLAI